VKTRGRIKIDYGRDMAIIRSKGQWLTLAGFLLFLAVLPHLLSWTGNVSWVTFLNFTMITIIAVLGLNIITGMAGQISLGHSAFIMVGAYTFAILTVKGNFPYWAALPISALITAVAGILVGAPSLRLKGFYLAVATFAFFFVAQYIIRILDITGGPLGLIGIPSATIGNLKINTDIEWYYLILALTIIFMIFSANLTRSRLGRAFLAVRDSDITAASMGINIYLTKLRAFFIGSLFAGIAGALWTGYTTVVTLEQFTIWDSIWYLGMIVIGGAGSTAGAVTGVLFLRLVSQILHTISIADWASSLSSNVWISMTFAIYGLVIVLFVSFQPYGLISVWRKIKMQYKRWPFGY